MPFDPRKFLMVAALPLLAGCQDLGNRLDYTAVQVERAAQGDKFVSPGLEPLHAAKGYRANPPSEPPPPQPMPPERDLVPFPVGVLTPDQAEMLLAGDPMALRFLALKLLTARGLVPVDEAVARKQANLGALLPLTTPEPPAAGLEAPIPPLPQVMDRFGGLGTGAERGNVATRAAERDFLTDVLLPKQPAKRQPYSPPDIASARKLQDRLARLEDAGLVTPEERAEETEAVDKLIASGVLPEVLQPPKPPEKPKKKKVGGRGNRMPGGVSGRLEIIPSPPGVEAPKLAGGAKGPAGVHLLSMGSAAHGDKAWEALTKEHAELGGLGHTVSRADLGELGVTYRLVAGPVEPAQAESLCATLRTRGQACTPTPFPDTANGK